MSKLRKIPIQPEVSHSCGQTCVAYLAEITVEESVNLFGSDKKTSTKQVTEALRKLGFECSGKLNKRIKRNRALLPSHGLYLVKITRKDKRRGHWVIWNADAESEIKNNNFRKGLWYDPALGKMLHRDYIWRGGEPTSYMKITSKKDDIEELIYIAKNEYYRKTYKIPTHLILSKHAWYLINKEAREHIDGSSKPFKVLHYDEMVVSVLPTTDLFSLYVEVAT